MTLIPCLDCGALTPRSRCPKHERAKNRQRTRRPTRDNRDTTAWRKLSQACIRRDHETCQHCGATRQQGARLHAHHITSRRAGGPDTLDNLTTICHRCHPTVEADQRNREARSFERTR